jgi:hypothetical protein
VAGVSSSAPCLIRSTGAVEVLAADTDPVNGNDAVLAALCLDGGPMTRLLATAPPMTVTEANVMIRTLRST